MNWIILIGNDDYDCLDNIFNNYFVMYIPSKS